MNVYIQCVSIPVLVKNVDDVFEDFFLDMYQFKNKLVLCSITSLESLIVDVLNYK